MTNDKPCCQNCRHYVSYYAKIGAAFKKLNIGHCKVSKCKSPKLCERFENTEKDKAARKKSAAEYIKTIDKNLSLIASALVDDKENP